MQLKHLRYIIILILFLSISHDTFAQSQGYFLLRGRVKYNYKEIEKAEIRVYCNNNLEKKLVTPKSGKFSINFDFNKQYRVSITKNDFSILLFVNTNVPKKLANKVFDVFQVINLHTENDSFSGLLFSYNNKSNKFVFEEAPKGYSTSSLGDGATLKELQKQNRYLKKLVENYEETIKNMQTSSSQKKPDTEHPADFNVIPNRILDSVYIQKFIPNDLEKNVSDEELEKYKVKKEEFDNNKEIIDIRSTIEELSKNNQNSPSTKIKIKQNILRIRKKMLSLAKKQLLSDKSQASNQKEIERLKEREAKLFVLEYELNLAENTIENKNLELEKKRIQLLSLISALVLILFIVIIIFTNFKKKKRLNAKLEFQNQELRKLSIVASETTSAVVVTNEKGDFQWVNKACANLFGYDNRTIGKRNILHLGYDESINEQISEALKTGKIAVFDTSIKSGTGKSIWVHVAVTPIIDKRMVSKLVIIYSDITQIKEAQNQIVLQNKQIMDSINYAKRIQDATLPSEKLIKHYFPDSFIYFKPRDIVSGDFYWFTVQNEKLFIAAVDCTGHGVPGAFMSLIGNSLLNNIVRIQKIHKPSEILKELNKGVIKALNQSNYSGEDDSDDGMDLTICCFDKKKEELQIASANHTAFIINNKQEVIEIEGDDSSIGDTFFSSEDIEFTNHIQEFTKDTTIYLFSDGYPDQLGGEKDKKFLMKKFKELLHTSNNKSLDQLPSMLNNSLNNWKGNNKQTDDILVMGIRM